MIDVFASVGARVFDVSITDINQDPVNSLQRPGEPIDALRRRIGRDLQDGERNRHNVIIRPRSTTALIIQLGYFAQRLEKVKLARLTAFSQTQDSEKHRRDTRKPLNAQVFHSHK